MVTPVATLTLADVIAAVKRQFGDESGVQIVDSDITRWTNQAQREIVNKNPMIQLSASIMTGIGITHYELPDRLLQIESVFYDHCILSPVGYERISEELGPDFGQQGTPQYFYIWANVIYLWPVPDQSKQLDINYSAMPKNVTAPADLLGLPDRYFERICEYVKGLAYELDEDWTANQVQMQKFEDKLLEANNADKNQIGSFLVAKDTEYE